MRRRYSLTLFGIILGCSCSLLAAPPAAEEIPAPVLTVRAYYPSRQLSPEARDAEIARLRYHLYRRVEYPQRLSQLDDEIRLAVAELYALDRQIWEYERITLRYSNPFLVTLESARMRRLDTALRLKNLRQEKLLLVENYQSERRLRKLELGAGAP